MKKLLVSILFLNLNVFANEDNQAKTAPQIGMITNFNSTKTAELIDNFNKQHSASKKYVTESSNVPPFAVDEELARKAMLCLTLPEAERLNCFSYHFLFYVALCQLECVPHYPDAPPICREYDYYAQIAFREIGYLTEVKPNYQE